MTILSQSISFSDPEEFEAYVEPVSGSVQARPHSGSQVNGKVQFARLSRIGFLALDSEPMSVRIPPSHGFYGVTMTLGTPFNISDGGKSRTYNRDCAHLLAPDREFNFMNREKGSILGTNFFVDNLPDLASRLTGGEKPFQQSVAATISLATPSGSSLARYLTFIWNEINRGGGILNSQLVAKEIEDSLIAALVWTIEENHTRVKTDKPERADAKIRRAEEYLLANLCNPVSRVDLAEISCTSIRSLSRAFLKRHGMGPMEFLRQRRLEAARMELLLAEPGEKTVSEIALRYGFSQPSKFSTAYKKAFNETPSETLQR